MVSISLWRQSAIIRAMKRLLLSVVASLVIISALPAFSVTDENPLDSPLASVSYTGRFSDVFSNPAALALMETEPGFFALSASISDSLSGKLFGSDPMPLLQNQKWNLQASFIARYVALTAFYGNEFNRIDGEGTRYDIHSSLHLEVDMAYSVPHFSIGARVSGGNRMIREDKVIDNIGAIFTNAWFSPFERESGSESFAVGVGTIVYWGPVTGGIYVGEVLTLRDGNIYFGWDALAESTTLSLSVGAGRYTKSGDLRFFRPRCSVSMTGLVEDATRSIEAEGELTFQFLPESSVSLAVSYVERHHTLLSFKPENGFVGIFLRGEGEGFSGTIGFTFKATDFSSFAPCFVFSYVS